MLIREPLTKLLIFDADVLDAHDVSLPQFFGNDETVSFRSLWMQKIKCDAHTMEILNIVPSLKRFVFTDFIQISGRVESVWIRSASVEEVNTTSSPIKGVGFLRTNHFFRKPILSFQTSCTKKCTQRYIEDATTARIYRLRTFLRIQVTTTVRHIFECTPGRINFMMSIFALLILVLIIGKYRIIKLQLCSTHPVVRWS